MTSITVSIDILAPVSQVWAEAADLESHVEWMADAESIRFVGDRRSGIGALMEVDTVVGPLRTRDVMEVVEWEEERTIGVRHRGVVTGEGRFRLDPVAGGTRFSWTEQLSFPWFLGGEVTAHLARPILVRIWRRNLEGLAARVLSRGSSES